MGVATVEEFIQSLQHAEMPLSKRVAVECIHQLSGGTQHFTGRAHSG